MGIGFLQFIRLSRLFDSVYPVMSLFLGAVVVSSVGDGRLYVLILVVVSLNSVAMVWNDIEDRDIDARNGRTELAEASQRDLRRLKMYIAATLALTGSAAWFVNPFAFAMVVATVAVIWLYNSRPFRASRRPVASLVVLSGAGAFLPYLFGLSLGLVSLYMVTAGLLWWFGRISVSVLKDYKDVAGDARHYKQTFLLRYGARRTAVASVVTLLVGYGGFILSMYPHTEKSWALPILASAIGLLVYVRRNLFVASYMHAQYDKIFRVVAQYQLLLDAGVVWWLL